MVCACACACACVCVCARACVCVVVVVVWGVSTRQGGAGLIMGEWKLLRTRNNQTSITGGCGWTGQVLHAAIAHRITRWVTRRKPATECALTLILSALPHPRGDTGGHGVSGGCSDANTFELAAVPQCTTERAVVAR